MAIAVVRASGSYQWFELKADEVGGSCSTGIERAKVQLSSTARKGATQ